MPFCYCKNKLMRVFHAYALLFKMNFFTILPNNCRLNSWSITEETDEKLTQICALDLSVLPKSKFLKLIIVKRRKILPGSKSCNSQQGVKRCFGIRWYAFRWQDLLEVCRIQTSSVGKEQSDIKLNYRSVYSGAPFLGIDSIWNYFN